MNLHPTPAWRPAHLRGFADGPTGAHAVVQASPGQFLQVPLPADPALCRTWRQRLGQRVWVDLNAHPFVLITAAPQETRRHA